MVDLNRLVHKILRSPKSVGSRINRLLTFHAVHENARRPAWKHFESSDCPTDSVLTIVFVRVCQVVRSFVEFPMSEIFARIHDCKLGFQSGHFFRQQATLCDRQR